ncbi:hypothetical protein F0Q45_23220 [Mycobacterium simiae]|uniref:Uncharacterized protein n=1 Tax=Mycobacterium simiae TaxID=1784 RepID=A0A5B1BDK9_MYCSI|nr:hypothetical protein F0Q45_23220 [Mycobacterium simiae]
MPATGHQRRPSLRCWRVPGPDRCGPHIAGPGSRAPLSPASGWGYLPVVAACTHCIVVGAGHGRNSIAVLPIRTGTPIGTRTAVVTFALSR